MSVKNFFSKEQKEEILKAIQEAEKDTSGEIRLHIESNCKGEPLDRAVKVFEKLKMHKTKLRNGVLIYLAVKDRKFSIFGDEGINKAVPDNFWEEVKDEMRVHFVKEEFATGVSKGIRMAGQKLKEFFPYQQDDVNELPDDISIGD